jgi:tetratricopeptide (TPR) repeat protein
MRAGGATEVASELANLVWMRRGDVGAAEAVLDVAFHAGGQPQPLLLAKATLFEAAGDLPRAAALLEAAIQQIPADLPLLFGAIQIALRRERPDDAERYVGRAQAVDPGARGVVQYAAIVDLARGRADMALARLRGALQAHPADQSLWGWAATAARASGDPLYGELCEYDAVVGAYDIEVPEG